MPRTGHQNEHYQFKDRKREARFFAKRVMVSLGIVGALFVVLIVRFYNLQVTHHQNYVTQSDSNRIQVRPAPPTRGLIYDRNGNLLADNRASFTVTIVKERSKDLDKTIDALAALIDVKDNDRKNFYRALKQRRRPYESVPLRYQLTEQEIAKIAVNEYNLEGVEVEAQLVRHYPYGELFAHTIGYVGQINERELTGFNEYQYPRYNGTFTIGKIGLEKYYESQLLGEVGTEHVEVNAHGRLMRSLNRVAPKPGHDLHLAMDLTMQQAAAGALKGARGAIVVVDVKTGGVLTMLSSPSFDPNLFVTGISFADYKHLNESKDLPLFNRAIQGQYPPASTLKPVLGLGGLAAGVVNRNWTIRDPGFYQLENDERKYRDWKRWGHGNRVDLHQAIVESCDTFFYDLSVRMGIDRIHPVGVEFGLGQKTGIDVPNEREGLWPSRVWKKGARGLPWFPGDSLNVSIGQGDVLTTPLQLAVMTATLASKGVQLQPHLVDAIGGEAVKKKQSHHLYVDDEHWQYISHAMEAVTRSARGTAAAIFKDANYEVAGKTGTAQVIGIAQNERYDRDKVHARNRDHALFIAYAPAKEPQIAVAVIVENGEHGSSEAAPMARKMFDTWFSLGAGSGSSPLHTQRAISPANVRSGEAETEVKTDAITEAVTEAITTGASQ